MLRQVAVASQLDLPLASVANTAADATELAPDCSPESCADQLPLFPPTVASLPTRPRAGRAFIAFRKLGELLSRQTSRRPSPLPAHPHSEIHHPKSATP